MQLKSICGILLLTAVGVVACKKSAQEGKTPYGYPYIHHVSKGSAKPQPGQYCYFNVDMVIADSIVSSNRETGELAKFPIPTKEQERPGQQPPVLEGLKLMSVGDSLTVFLPIDSLPEKKIPGFDGAKNVAYRLSLVAIKSEEEYKKEMEAVQKEMEAKAAVIKEREGSVAAEIKKIAADYKAKKLDSQLKSLDGGLKYLILEEGKGATPTKGENISVQYYGVLPNGTMFDNSFKNGYPFKLPIGTGRVIPGWDQGLMALKKGTKAVLFIPSELGYGKAGSPPAIPPDSELLFYVEIAE